jgi:hypothetical protein
MNDENTSRIREAEGTGGIHETGVQRPNGGVLDRELNPEPGESIFPTLDGEFAGDLDTGQDALARLHVSPPGRS